MSTTKDVWKSEVRGQALGRAAADGQSGSVAAPVGRSNFASRLSLKAPTLLLVAAAGSAVLIGYNIAAERWLFVLAIALGIGVLFAPVPVALGGFALLVPLDGVLATGQAGASTTLTALVGAAAAVVLLFTGLAGHRLKAPPTPTYWWLLLGVWALVSASWALDPQRALQSLVSFFSLLTLYVIAVSLQANDKEIRWVLLSSVSGAVLASLLAMYQFYQGHFYHQGSRGSLIVGDRHVNPNAFAIGLLLPLALAIEAFVSATGRLQKMMALAAFVALSTAVMVTMSRGGMLAVVVILFVYLYRCRKIWRRFRPLGLIFLPILVMPDTFFQRLREAGETGGAGRLDIWTATWATWKHYAVFGAGFANFSTAYTEFAGEATRFEGFGRDAHNIFFAVAVELGLVGFGFFVAALYSAFRAASKALRPMAAPSLLLVGCEAACWGTLAGSCFSNTIYYKSFWLSFILLAMVTRNEAQRARVRGLARSTV